MRCIICDVDSVFRVSVDLRNSLYDTQTGWKYDCSLDTSNASFVISDSKFCVLIVANCVAFSLAAQS